MRFEGPIFLVGMPRSGTKLVRDLLNRHPRIGIPEIETEFLPWMAANFRRFGELNDLPTFRSFHRRMMGQTYFRLRTGRGSIVTADEWFAACRTFDVAGVFEALVRLDVGATPGSGMLWGDKSPSYIDDLPLLRHIYPESRIVHIVRDVRDYCISINQAWGKHMLRAAQRWTDGVASARHAGLALGTSYCELRYEDLLRNPAAELGRLCEFVGVDYRAEMLALSRPSENLGNTRGASHIVAANHGNYRSRMTERTRAQIEAIAGGTLTEFGYVLSLPKQTARRLSTTQMRLAQLCDGWHLIRDRTRRRTPLESLRYHLRYFRTTRG